ncbi:MAG: hypothetical protein BWK79_00835 [Beggiatoa sp. IS2]|nr:MAG: hypothetical protein BWK79_00835 [Beggiatoa sp. IS2]
MTNPLVSVVIPTKNRHHLINTAITSVLQQTYSNIEIIVVDDGSDEPLKLDITDSRVKCLRLEPSRGSSAARNVGLRAAQGEFLSLLDDDDYYYPDKTEKQLNYLQTHPEVDLVFSRVLVVEDTGKSHIYLNDHYVHETFRNFCYFNVIHNNATLFHRRVIEKVLFDERISKYNDMQFHLAISLVFAVHYLPLTVGVWNKLGRPDQLTTRNYRLSYQNFKLICEVFQEMIDSSPLLKRRYYGRLGILAGICLDPLAAIRAFAKTIF